MVLVLSSVSSAATFSKKETPPSGVFSEIGTVNTRK